MPRLGPALVALVLLTEALMQASARAAPVVEVKSRSRLQLDGVQRDGDMVVVTGRLFDPQTSLGIPKVHVDLVVAGIPIDTETDADGRFFAAVSAPPGRQVIQMKYEGNDSIDTTSLDEEADPELTPVTLSFEARPTATGVELTVTAKASSSTFDAPITLFVDRPGGDEMREVARGTAGVAIELSRKQLGGAGTRRFRADYAGDATHQPATVSGTYELTSASKTSLAVEETSLAYEDTLTASGSVTDEDGTGLAGAVVTLVSGDRRLATTASDRAGRFRFLVEGEILGAGAVELQALAEPGGAVQLSRSEPVRVKVALPQPVPITYTLLAFAATGIAAAAFFLARTKPWRRFAKEGAPAQQVVQHAEAQQGGLVANKPSLVSTLRRASDHGFSGAVRDTVRGRPVPGAVVRLHKAGAAAGPADTFADSGQTSVEYRATAGDDGGFAIEDVPAGEWVASVSASAHITEAFGVALPHRGELRGVRVDLVPVREKVFLLYQRAAMPVLPDPKLWGVWSPRQVVDHVRATRPSPALAKLTDFVEEVYFSARAIEESVLPSARQRVDAAISERAERAERPAAPQ